MGTLIAASVWARKIVSFFSSGTAEMGYFFVEGLDVLLSLAVVLAVAIIATGLQE